MYLIILYYEWIIILYYTTIYKITVETFYKKLITCRYNIIIMISIMCTKRAHEWTIQIIVNDKQWESPKTI